MRSYPIYVKVKACIYGSDKSYGVKETGEQTVYVGQGSNHSHEFADVVITNREKQIGGVTYRRFVYSFDDCILKIALFNIKTKDYKVVFDRLRQIDCEQEYLNTIASGKEVTI